MIIDRENMTLRVAVRFALAGGALGASGFAAAQTAPPTASAVVEEVVVTGSRVSSPNQISISPVIAVGALEVQQTGVTRVEDLLNSLPQVFAAQGSEISNGASGTAEVDLRGLGPKRTLVLVNGRRLAPGDPVASSSGGGADLNQIPAALIERVDVLTGGASSVYGADAVAGVVNFVLNNHFEGVKFSTNYGFNQHHNDNPQGVNSDLLAWNASAGTNFTPAPSNVNTGFTKDLSLMIGFNAPDGRGNVTAYATYRNVAAVLQNDFDYSACSLGSGYIGSTSVPSGHFGCAGSSTATPGRYRLVTATGVNLPGSQGGGSKTINPDGTLRAFGNQDRFNFGPVNYYQRPDERYTAGAFMHYEMSEHADVYAEVQYMNDRSIAQIAPSGSFYGGAEFKLGCDNPYFSASMQNTWCQTGGVYDPAKQIYLLVGRRNVEGGNRQDDLEHGAWRLVLGTKGKITDAWNYDFSGQYSITQLSENYLYDVSTNRMRNALDVTTNAAGAPVCRSVVTGTDLNCVPWNVWQPGKVTQAAIGYITVPLVSRGEVTQRILGTDVTGDLGVYGVQLPSAKSGLRVNLGLNWQETSILNENDLEYELGDASGQGSPHPSYTGSITAREAFVEGRLPLIDEKPGADSLALETGYRYSDYSLGFSTNTYKFGVEWSPIQQLRVRGSYARAVRAPNIGELFQPRYVGLDGSVDFCSGGAPVYSLAQCASQGVTAAQYGHIDPNPAAQYNGRIGGDPTLKPETATTKSFGIGWSPSFLNGFRVQVDYFDIKIADTIQRIGPTTLQGLCSNEGQFCDRIHRDVNGSLWVSTSGYIDDPLANQGALQEKGVDIDLSYGFDIGSYGKVRMNLVGTHMSKYLVTPLESVPSTQFDCAGYYGNNCTYINVPNYSWRHTFRATWSTPWRGLDVTLGWRYFNSVKLDQLSSDPNLTAGTGDVVGNGIVSSTDAKIPAVSYIDLSGAMNVNDHIVLRVGINNLLDKSPPAIGSSNCAGCNGNTYSQVYDTLGRYVFGTATIRF